MIPTRTVGQKWRARRAVVLWTAWKAQVSRDILQDVFDLGRTRVLQALDEVQDSLDEMEKAGHRDPLKHLLRLTERPPGHKTKRRRKKKLAPSRPISEAQS